MKIKFNQIYRNLEAFIADIDMSFFLDQTEVFMKKHLNENMTEEEAIEYLETNFLFDNQKSKPDVLIAADILRAIRMGKYNRDAQNS